MANVYTCSSNTLRGAYLYVSAPDFTTSGGTKSARGWSGSVDNKSFSDTSFSFSSCYRSFTATYGTISYTVTFPRITTYNNNTYGALGVSYGVGGNYSNSFLSMSEQQWDKNSEINSYYFSSGALATSYATTAYPLTCFLVFIRAYLVTFKSSSSGTVLLEQYVLSGFNAVPPNGITTWSGSYTNITADKTLVSAYVVSYDANGGSVSPSSDIVDIDESVTLPSPTRTGYTVNGWYTAATDGSRKGSAGASYTPTADITLYAHWTANTYWATFNINGGAFGDGTTDAKYLTLKYDTNIYWRVQAALSSTTDSKPPSRTGHTFDGWATSSTGTTYVWNSGGEAVKGDYWSNNGSAALWKYDGNLMVYAKWTVKQYDLTLTLGEHVTKIYYKINGAQNWTEITEETTLSVNYGSTWYGYAETSDGYTTDYPDSDKPFSKTKEACVETQEFTAYGESYPIYFTSNYNSFSERFTRWYTFGEKLGTVPVPTPRSGYSFVGWFTQGLVPAQVTEDTVLLFNPDEIEQYLAAHWEGKLYSIYFDDNSTVVEFTYSDEPGKTFETCLNSGNTWPTPTRTGYTFKEWNTQQNGSGQAKSKDSVVEASDIYLWSQWQANNYTITLSPENGGSDSTVSATYGKNMPEITAPTRYGYDFGGYYTQKNGKGTQYYTNSGKSSRSWYRTSDTTLYAKWTPKSVTIGFDLNNGPTSTVPDNQSGIFGNAYGELPNIIATGASFLGWFTDATNGAKIDSTNIVSSEGPITLYAHWTDPWMANLTYQLYEGSFDANDNPPVQTAYTTVATIPAPKKANFRFIGWSVAGADVDDLSNGAKWGKSVSNNTISNPQQIQSESLLIGNSYNDSVYVTGLPRKDGANIVFYARWKKVDFDITISAPTSSGFFTIQAKIDSGNAINISDGDTITVASGEQLELIATMTASEYYRSVNSQPVLYAPLKCTYGTNGTNSEKKFSAEDANDKGFAVFKWEKTFSANEVDNNPLEEDDRFVSQLNLTIATMSLTLQIDNENNPSNYANDLEHKIKLTQLESDSDNQSYPYVFDITPNSNEKVEPKKKQTNEIDCDISASNQDYYFSSTSERILVAADPAITCTLKYDLTRINVAPRLHDASSQYSNLFSIYVAEGMSMPTDLSSSVQSSIIISYGGSATVYIEKKEGYSADPADPIEFAGWYDENEILKSEDDTYTITNITKDINVYAKLRVPVVIRAHYEGDGVSAGNASIAVKEGSEVVYNTIINFPYITKITLGNSISIKAQTLDETAHFSGWFYYGGDDSTPFGSSLEWSAENTWEVDSAIYNIIARFKNSADVYYVAICERDAETKAMANTITFTTNATSAQNDEIREIEEDAYKNATKSSDSFAENAVFLEVTDPQRLVITAYSTSEMCGSFMLCKPPSSNLVLLKEFPSTNKQTQLSVASVVNADYIYYFDKGDSSRVVIIVEAQIDNNGDTKTVMGSVRVGSAASSVEVKQKIGEKIIQESGKFVVGRTATIYAFAENGYEFDGWYVDEDKKDAEAVYSFTPTSEQDNTSYVAKFRRAEYALYEWEGAQENKLMTWRSKVYELSKPANLTSVRIDAQGYDNMEFKSATFSAPNAVATQVVNFKYISESNNTRISSQTMRRLPQRRPERYFQVEVKNDAEVDAIIVGTSGEGLAT